jgi:hypothetical protein
MVVDMVETIKAQLQEVLEVLVVDLLNTVQFKQVDLEILQHHIRHLKVILVDLQVHHQVDLVALVEEVLVVLVVKLNRVLL